jgi:hypothetical protein
MKIDVPSGNPGLVIEPVEKHVLFLRLIDHVIVGWTPVPTVLTAQAIILSSLVNISRPNQGDRIGRIFAYWAIVYFGQGFEDYSSSNNF